MNIKIIKDTNTAVFKMGNTLENIKLVAKQASKSLYVYDNDGEIVFAAACAAHGAGSLNSIGAEFSPEASNDGKAKIAVTLPADLNDAKLYLADEFGSAIKYLEVIDTQIVAALENITQNRARIREIVQIID